MKRNKQCLVVVDEYGDGKHFEIKDGKFYLCPEDQELLRLDKFSILDIKNIIISLHPDIVYDSKLVHGLNIDKTFEEHFLSNVLRNSKNIFDRFKAAGSVNLNSSKLSTVLGYKPEVVKGDVDNSSYYMESIDMIKKKTDKFVCIEYDKLNFSLFEEELKRREITLFRYDNVEHDSGIFKDFIKSKSGCLLTNYNLARGTECQSLLLYQKGIHVGSELLRCTVNLVYCIPDSNVDVNSPSPGLFYKRLYFKDSKAYLMRVPV